MKEAVDSLVTHDGALGKGGDGGDSGECLLVKYTVLARWGPQSRLGPAKMERSCIASCPVPGPEYCVVIHAQKACLSGFCIGVGWGGGQPEDG